MSSPPILRTLLLALLSAHLAGCDRDGVRVRLRSEPPTGWDVRRLRLTAEVAGRQNDLRYHWYTVAGSCDPQVSDDPATSFRFADGTTRDRVSVEIWRGDERLAVGELNVKLQPERAIRATEKVPGVRVAITTVPPYQPEGGSDTRATMRGRVSGRLSPDLRVVIYARADVWYLQPLPLSILSIGPDGAWASWTHTGSSYAALVVRPGFEPVPRIDVLPAVGGYVVARAIVEGARR